MTRVWTEHRGGQDLEGTPPFKMLMNISQEQVSQSGKLGELPDFKQYLLVPGCAHYKIKQTAQERALKKKKSCLVS